MLGIVKKIGQLTLLKKKNNDIFSTHCKIGGEFTCGEINELHKTLFFNMGYHSSNSVLVECHYDRSFIGKCYEVELVGRQSQKGF